MPARKPFIADQRMRRLEVDGNPREYLSADYFRQLRVGSEEGGRSSRESPHDAVWKPIDRREVSGGLRDGRYSRMVIVTDAGMGKSTTMAWLNYRLNLRPGRTVAFLLDVSELPDDPDLLPGELAKRMANAVADSKPARPGEAEQLVKRLRRQGRIALLLDSLDQAGEAKLAVLNALLGQSIWENCPIVVSGRPYIIEQHLGTQRRECLFCNYDRWDFLQLEDFDERQQRRYLGDQRYEAIPEDARRILSNPRVLYYLSEVREDRVAAIQFPSDVYLEATKSLLEDGILGARGAQGLSAPDARVLLSGIAFQMTLERNFDGVTTVQMPEFLGKLAARCQTVPSWTHGDCQPHLVRLAAMNTFLSHGLLEPGCPQQLFWRDRSLQEYFAGSWLAQYATESHAQELYKVLCEDFDERSGELAWVYRFAAEMPDEGRNPAAWIRAMEPLYRPGDGTVEGTHRCSEMIYRSWATMESYAKAEAESEARTAAKRTIDAFQGEFQELLHFPLSLRERVGVREREGQCQSSKLTLLARFRRLLRRIRQRGIARRLLAEFRNIPPDAGEGETRITFWMGSPENEKGRWGARETQRQMTLSIPFELACYPVTNEQFELFDPTRHARRDRRSQENTCPVIWVSCYDAWAFCRWLGAEYRLPSEIQWEFACRASRSTDPEESTCWCYGNNEAELAEYAWYRANSEGRTHPVGHLRSNDWGLFDMHGNVLEWTDSAYAEDPRRATGSEDPAVSARVLRGGSWLHVPWLTRSANRYGRQPSLRGYLIGFRVARASRKP